MNERAHTSPATEIAVIIVNYGTAELAIKAVESVCAREHGGRRVNVHLVDHASPGREADTLREAHAARGWSATVKLWLEGENHGFGRGNNLVLTALAAQSEPPEKIFLLNPDARLENEAIDILATALDADASVAAAGACVLRPDLTPVTAAFRFPSMASEIARAINLTALNRLLRDWTVPLPPDQPPGLVDWVSGASVLFRFDALQKVGFFDPGFFLYYEEVDLMHRAARAGWETWFVPEARVVHAEGAATNVRSGTTNRPRRPAYWYRSWRKYFSDTYGPAGVRLAALCWVAGAAGNRCLAMLPGRGTSVPARFFRDFWSVVLRPLLGLREGSL